MIAKTLYLLARTHGANHRLLDMVSRQFLIINFSIRPNVEVLQKLIAKYQDLPMSIADACLVRMSELRRDSAVFTLDNHFSIYRRNGRQTIPVIARDF